MRRYRELERGLAGISPLVLALQQRHGEVDGLLLDFGLGFALENERRIQLLALRGRGGAGRIFPGALVIARRHVGGRRRGIRDHCRRWVMDSS